MSDPTLTRRIEDALDRWNRLSHQARARLRGPMVELSLQLGEFGKLHRLLKQNVESFERRLELEEVEEEETPAF